MSLILPPFYFADCTDNFSGTTPAGTNPGTTITASATPNTDGTAVSLIAAVAHDVHFLVVGIGGRSTTSTVDSASLLDILVDPAGGTSWSSMIDDLVAGFQPQLTSGSVGYMTYYMFPLFIKSGSSIGAQVRSATASQAVGLGVWVYGNPSRPDMWWCGSKVESLGITAASSKGTDITPGSTTATFTWTNVGATTSGRYGSIQFGQNGSDSSSTSNIGYHAQIGIGSARVPGTPTFVWQTSASENASREGFNQPIWCDIPEGTQLQVGACASGTAEVHDVALYGCY